MTNVNFHMVLTQKKAGMGITRINEFHAASGKESQLYGFLKSIVPYITSCDGCISCEVLKNADQADAFVVIEKWISIEAHQKSLAGFPKEEMQSAMVLFGAPPKGSYYKQ